MGEVDDNIYCDIRAFLDGALSGECHVDWQDAARGHQTVLMKLCYLNEDEDTLLEFLDEILSHNPDVNVTDVYRRTALMHACMTGVSAVADGLLYLDETSVDAVDNEGDTALTFAVKAHDVHMVEKLVSHPKVRASELLIAKTKGQTPLELAITLDNEAIEELLMTSLKYVTSFGPEKNITEFKHESRAVRKERDPKSRAFITSKSHSDPLLLRRRCGESALLCGETVAEDDSRQSDLTGRVLSGGSRGTAPRSYEPLPPLSTKPKTISKRRDSVSLPDLSNLPTILSHVNLENDRDSESEETQSEDESENDSDEYEMMRMKLSQKSRKNSISLPDLNLGTKQSTTKNRGNINRGSKHDQLKLPDIHMCNSPSLPALDKLSNGKMELLKQNSVRGVNSPVRRVVDGKSDSFMKVLRQRKDIVPSVT